jgi:hypothetical protein
LALLNQVIDEFKVGEIISGDGWCKEIEEQALKLIIRCNELRNVSSKVKTMRQEMIENIQNILTKLVPKVSVYRQ